jgi:hypothetical protein
LALRKPNIFQAFKSSFAFHVYFGEELRTNLSMYNLLTPRLCGGLENLLVILTVTIPEIEVNNKNKKEEIPNRNVSIKVTCAQHASATLSCPASQWLSTFFSSQFHPF